MATKKQKRQAALAKREAFLAAERERNAKNLEKSRSKRAEEKAYQQRKDESTKRLKTAKRAASKIPHDDGHEHVLQGDPKPGEPRKCIRCGHAMEPADA